MQCLTKIIGVTTAQGIDILETQGIDFEALKLLTDSNVKTLFDDKALKGVPLIKRMRFVALRDWAYSTLHASPDLFDRTKMATVMARIAASSKKAPPSIKPTEPPTFSAERKDWPKWKRSAEAYFSLVPTSNPNKMLFYVIRTESMSTSDTLSVDSSIKSNGASYDSAIDRDLMTPEYDTDNETVWNLLKKFLSSTVAWSYIMDYAESRDGRGAWKAMLKNYEGVTSMKLRKSEARELVKNNSYSGETAAHGLDDFIRTFKDAYSTLKTCGYPVDEDEKVENLIKQCICPAMATVMSTIQSKGTDTFEEAIDFMVDRAQTLGIYTQKKKLARSVSSQSRKKGGGKNNSNKQNNGKGGNSKSKTPSSFIERSVWETMSAEAKASHQAKYQKSLSSKASRQVSSMKRKSESKSVKFKGVDGDDDSDPDEGEDTDTGSGANFGRTGQIQKQKKSKVGAYKSSERRTIGAEIGIPPRMASANKTSKHRATTAGTAGTFRYDSHADTICCGRGWTVLEYTAQNCDVAPFSRLLPTLKDVPIVTAATVVYNKTTEEWFLLVVHQALWLGEDEEHSLICPNQLRMNGIMCDDIPLHLARLHNGASSLHGIRLDAGTVLPFSMDGTISKLDIRTPTDNEIETLPRYELSSPKIWDPQLKELEEREREHEA